MLLHVPSHAVTVPGTINASAVWYNDCGKVPFIWHGIGIAQVRCDIPYQMPPHGMQDANSVLAGGLGKELVAIDLAAQRETSAYRRRVGGRGADLPSASPSRSRGRGRPIGVCSCKGKMVLSYFVISEWGPGAQESGCAAVQPVVTAALYASQGNIKLDVQSECVQANLSAGLATYTEVFMGDILKVFKSFGSSGGDSRPWQSLSCLRSFALESMMRRSSALNFMRRRSRLPADL